MILFASEPFSAASFLEYRIFGFGFVRIFFSSKTKRPTLAASQTHPNCKSRADVGGGRRGKKTTIGTESQHYYMANSISTISVPVRACHHQESSSFYQSQVYMFLSSIRSIALDIAL